MEKILSFVLGLWAGGAIVLLNYVGNKAKTENEKIIEKIDIDLIKIKPDFERVKPRRDKLNERIAYYEKTGEFYTPIILNEDDVLIDGYISYIIAKRYGKKKVEIIRNNKGG